MGLEVESVENVKKILDVAKRSVHRFVVETTNSIIKINVDYNDKSTDQTCDEYIRRRFLTGHKYCDKYQLWSMCQLL